MALADCGGGVWHSLVSLGRSSHIAHSQVHPEGVARKEVRASTGRRRRRRRHGVHLRDPDGPVAPDGILRLVLDWVVLGLSVGIQEAEDHPRIRNQESSEPAVPAYRREARLRLNGNVGK